MLIQVCDWQFDVDVALNMEFSSKQALEHCMCGYCRNYYHAIDKTYPSLRPFLLKFGIDIEGPDELSPFEPTIYEASYIVNGSICRGSDGFFYVDGVPVMVINSADADMDTVRPNPYFVLVVGLMELPWVIDEDPLQVISPANEESYLERMERKLLKRLQNESMYS